VAIDANTILQASHLMGFVVDAERHLVRFSCLFCGGTTEPLEVGKPLPASFTGVPHVTSCLVIAEHRGTNGKAA